MEYVSVYGLLAMVLSLLALAWWRPRGYPEDLEASSEAWPVGVKEAPVLTPEQEEMIEPILQILNTDDPRHIIQAFQLLDALGDPLLTEALAWGIYIGEDHRFAIREDARLAAIQGMGVYDYDTRTDMCQLTALYAAVRSDLFETATILELELPTTEGLAALLTDAVASAHGLEELRIGGFYELSDLGFLQGLRSLKRLNLSLGGNLKNVEGLSELSDLEEINLNAQEALEDISGLSGLTSLQVLDLQDCPGLTDISELATVSELREISLRGCVNVTDVTPLVSLEKVTRLDLRGCTGLPEELSRVHSAIGMPLALATLLRATERSADRAPGARDPDLSEAVGAGEASAAVHA